MMTVWLIVSTIAATVIAGIAAIVSAAAREPKQTPVVVFMTMWLAVQLCSGVVELSIVMSLNRAG